MTDSDAQIDAAPREEWFTLVFQGNIRDFPRNPLREETVFGVPYAVGVGNAFDELDALSDGASMRQDGPGSG